MANIVAFSGKKQSGKNTSGNFLLGMKMIDLGLTHGIEMTKKGQLLIRDLYGDAQWEGVFAYESTVQTVRDFIDTEIHPWYKIYSFADLLKESLCIELLGLTHEQCYGTDEQKNTPTHLKWEDMPGVATTDVWGTIDGKKTLDSLGMTYHTPGFMTAREVMQFVGTDVMRKMYGDVWSKGTVKRILKEGSEMAAICDCRFPNEVEAVQEAGGKVIRLTRFTTDVDPHPSETALDGYKGFDAVIDNQNMSLGEQNGAIYDQLTKWGFPLPKLDGLETNIKE